MIDALLVYRGATLLADGDSAGAVGIVTAGPDGKADQDIAVSSPIDAEFVTFIDHTTGERQFAFQIERTHASWSAAMQHALTHDATVRGVADLVFQWTEAGSAMRVTFTDAAWVSVTSRAPMGCATFTTYTVRAGAHTVTDGEGGPLPEPGVTVLSDRQSSAIASAGATTITLGATVRDLYLRVTVAAGDGAYAHNLILDETAREDGNAVHVIVEMPASENPVIKFYTGAATGDALLTLPADAAEAFSYEVLFLFNETAGEWELWNWNQIV